MIKRALFNAILHSGYNHSQLARLIYPDDSGRRASLRVMIAKFMNGHPDSFSIDHASEILRVCGWEVRPKRETHPRIDV